MKSKHLNRSYAGDAMIIIILSIVGFIMVLPMVYTISSSLKPLNELWIFPPRFLVQHPTMENFSSLFSLMSDSRVPFSRYIFNTLLISVLGTAGHVLFASMCAYVLAKHDFYGRKAFFKIVELSLMFSTAVTAIPMYLVVSGLNMTNTYWAVIVPAFSASFGLYLMKQFMESMLPFSLIESARLDGAGEFRIFWKIVMPVVKPAWLTLIVFSFKDLWNSSANVYIYEEKLKSLNYAITQIVAGGISRAGTAAAASVFMMVVPILVFVVTQSNIIETMATSGMKD